MRQGSPRHPRKGRQSKSYRTNRLTSRENAKAKRRGEGTRLRGGRLPHPQGWANLAGKGLKVPDNQSRSHDVFYKVRWDWKVERIKAGAEMYFFKGGEKDSQAPSDDFLLDLADWLLGCHGCTSITVKFGQSGVKESSAPPFAKNNINILTFLLRVFKRLAAPPCFPYTLCLCAAGGVKERLISLYCQGPERPNTPSPFRALETGFPRQNDTAPWGNKIRDYIIITILYFIPYITTVCD